VGTCAPRDERLGGHGKIARPSHHGNDRPEGAARGPDIATLDIGESRR
jgi:hypothetical protein